jgi:hypothetical protein
VTLYQLSSSYKLATSQPVVIMTDIDTGSHNKLDLLQSLVPTHCCYHDSYWYWFTQQAWPATKSCTNTLLLSWLILILVHTTSLTCYKVLYQHTVAIMTHIDTSSHNKLDLIQSLVPIHYVYNWYVFQWFQATVSNYFLFSI